MPPTAETPIVARENLQGHYAGFASRFAAFVVDMVVITGAFMLVLAAINFAASILTGKDIDFNKGNLWVIIAYVIWAFIYFAQSWEAGRQDRRHGAVRRAGRARRWRRRGGRRAIVRTLAFPLSFLILGLGFLGILLGDQRRALHDVIAGTAVVYSWDARAARLRFLSRE